MGNRWGNSGNSVRLYFWGLQNHCRRCLQCVYPWLIHVDIWQNQYNIVNLKIKIKKRNKKKNERGLLLGKKGMTNLNNLLKSRDITLPIKVCLVKTMVFPVVMYGCESWTVKKAEHRRIDAFELWC